MTAVGLSHLSDAFRERLTTLAISAVSSDFPRLSLALRAIEEETDRILQRDARADESRLLQLIAQTYTLCLAIASDPKNIKPYLIGQHRRKYIDAGDLDLHGVAAYQWATQSDFHGLTVLFWDLAGKQWFTWSEARPRFHHSGFKPSSRYQADAPWNAGMTVKKLSCSHFVLEKAKANYQRRLSTSERTRLKLSGATQARQLDFGNKFFTDWQALARYIDSIRIPGLAESDPSDEIVVLKPAKWGQRAYDQVKQAFYFLIGDDSGAFIPMSVPYNTLNADSIKILEQVKIGKAGVYAVIGRVYLREGAAQVYPLALLCQKHAAAVINLTLDSPADSAPASVLTKIRKVWRPFNTGDLDESLNQYATASVDPDLVKISDDLLACAETGCTAISALRLNGFAISAAEMEKHSLTILANALRQLAAVSQHNASNLLKTYYLCGLYQQVKGGG